MGRESGPFFWVYGYDQEMKELTKLYFYNFFQMFLVLIPVIVPFWEARGISLQQVFLLQGAFGASLILFDMPAGYIADLMGRRRVMVLGSVITALGFQIMWLGSTFTDYLICELLLGLGISLQSGCDVALLYAYAGKDADERQRKTFLGHRVSLQALGEGVAALVAGWTVAISLDMPAYVNGAVAWICPLVAWSLKEPEGELLPRTSHFENVRAIKRALFNHSRRMSLAIWCFIFYGFATYCAVWALQPVWKSRGIDVTWFGYLWAANSFLVALVGRYAHAIEARLGPKKVLILVAVAPIIGYCGIGLVGGPMGLAFTLAFPVCRGLNQVLFQDVINSNVPANMRATTNSVGSLGMRAVFLVFGPLIGHGLDKWGVDPTMMVLGLIYVGMAFVLILPFSRELKA